MGQDFLPTKVVFPFDTELHLMLKFQLRRSNYSLLPVPPWTGSAPLIMAPSMYQRDLFKNHSNSIKKSISRKQHKNNNMNEQKCHYLTSIHKIVLDVKTFRCDQSINQTINWTFNILIKIHDFVINKTGISSSNTYEILRMKLWILLLWKFEI